MKKRSITIAGHATSLTLEDEFWDALKEISASKGLSIAGMIRQIDAQNEERTNLSSAIRIFILLHYRQKP
jgi:predicted DNA-binding ribbon-helix-helix protein